MSRKVGLGLVGIVALGGVFAFGLSKQGQVARVDMAHVTVPPAGFQTFAAAPIAGSELDGREFSLASLRGKPAFINFWEPTCIPCRKEAPQLRSFASELGGRASIVGVALDSPASAVRSFATTAGWRYPIVRERCCGLIDHYGVVGLPTTIVVDAQGRVVDRLIGAQTTARLRAELRALGV
jgi:cytochrome c biogenesis protein CcmG, thiol:disulfide interchange protein DsbE